MKKTGTYKTHILAAVMLFCIQSLSAQHIAVKTNLLYDALAVPSLGGELVMDSTHSVCLSATYNPVGYGRRKWKFWSVSPEIRRWQCLPLTGGFLGAALVAGGFNIQDMGLLHLSGKRAQGTFWGGGLTCGWHKILSAHWSLESGIGISLVHISYSRYLEGACGYKEKDKSYFSVLPFHTGVSLVYIIK